MKQIIFIAVRILERIGLLTPIKIARLRYFYKMHRWPDFEHPKDINEKINWLKFYGDTSLWPLLADKYAVRGWLTNHGFGDLLVRLYGKWDRVEDIEWEKLPERFVLKCNNGSGDIIICNDKSRLDISATVRHFKKVLNEPYGRLTAEPHYLKIKPCIIAEELLDASTQPCQSKRLVDYKLYCFYGHVRCVSCCSNRESAHVAQASTYDTDWNYHPEWDIHTNHLQRPFQLVPKPECLNQLLAVAGCLTKNLPFVRLDMYIVNNRIYFGEFTFTPSGGYLDNFTFDYLERLGDYCVLPTNM